MPGSPSSWGRGSAKSPHDLAAHRAARERRVVYPWSFKRQKRDNRAINKMVERAETVTDGTRPLKKDRFVKIDGLNHVVVWDLVKRARQLAGLKGYVTNISPSTMAEQACPLPMPDERHRFAGTLRWALRVFRGQFS